MDLSGFNFNFITEHYKWADEQAEIAKAYPMPTQYDNLTYTEAKKIADDWKVEHPIASWDVHKKSWGVLWNIREYNDKTWRYVSIGILAGPPHCEEEISIEELEDTDYFIEKSWDYLDW